MAFNPFKKGDWDKLGKQTKNEFNKVEQAVRDVGDDVKKVLQKTGADCRNGVRVMGRTVEDGLRQSANEIKDGFEKELPALAEKAFDETKVAFEKELPALIEDAARKLAQAASERSIKEALDNAADVIEMMAPTRFTLIFGVELALVIQGEVTVSCSFPNPVAKLTEIRKWAAKPPKGRSQIIECIKDFGPESLGVEFKISGNGMAAEWDGGDKYDRIDAFLKKHGV